MVSFRLLRESTLSSESDSDSEADAAASEWEGDDDEDEAVLGAACSRSWTATERFAATEEGMPGSIYWIRR